MRSIFTFLLALWAFSIAAQPPVPTTITEENLNQWIGELDLGFKTWHFFDQNGKIETATRYVWSGSSWELESKNERTYSTSGQPLEFLSLSWDGANFLPLDRQIYEYDAADHQTLYRSEKWNSANSIWVKTYEIQQVWAGDLLAESAQVSYDIAGAVESGFRAFNDYDSEGRLSVVVNQYYDTTTSFWVNAQRSDYEYMVSSADFMLYTVSVWDAATAAFLLPNTRHVQTVLVEPDWRQSTVTFESLVGTSWQPVFQNTVKTTNFELLRLYLSEQWDSDSQLWKTTYEISSALNPDGSLDSLYVRSIYFGPPELVLGQIQTFGYDPILSEKSSAEPFNVRIFPNPTSDFAEVFLDEKAAADLQLFDEKGQLVLEQRGVRGIAFLPIRELATGVYFLKIESKNGAATVRKLVKN